MNANVGYQIPGKAPVGQSGDTGYWNQQFRREPYYTEGDTYNDFEAAYQGGYEARQRHPDVEFESVEDEIRNNWEASKGTSKLAWDRARLAALRAWNRGSEPGGP